MRLTTISRFKVVAAMCKGFFNGFISGQIDARMPGKTNPEPREIKQITADNYNTLSAHFVNVLCPILIRLNYDDAEAVAEDMRKRRFSDSTSPKILLRYACGSRPLYDALTGEYRRQMGSLLNGRLQPVSAFFAEYDRGDEPTDEIPVALAIRSVVRTLMQAYASGLTAGRSELQALHQTTVYRLMLHGMVALLHDEPVEIEGDNLEMIFRRVAMNSDNFETLMNEMSMAHQDLSML